MFILSSCTYNCACDNLEPTKISLRPLPKGKQLVNECSYIKTGIADSKSFSKKMANSRYAIYYQAISRERISKLMDRAKELGCP